MSEIKGKSEDITDGMLVVGLLGLCGMAVFFAWVVLG
jgi:hypothetical protein